MDTVVRHVFDYPSERRSGSRRILVLPYEFLSYNSPLLKPVGFRINAESSVTDLIYILVTALLFGAAILYLRACERLK